MEQRDYILTEEKEDQLRYEAHLILDSDIVNHMNPQDIVELFEGEVYEPMQVW